MQLQIKHIDLFPTRIWHVGLSTQLAPHFEAWIKWIEDARAADTKRWGSNRGGWNSPKLLLDEPLFEPLATTLESVLKGVLKDMGVELPEGRLKIECWANVLDQGGFNVQHVHQNTLLSACFYLRVPKDSGAIVFRDPRAGAMFSGVRGKGVNNFSETTIKPAAGQLIVFPNWLEHRVEVNESPDSRISVALNVLGVARTALAPTSSA